MSMYADFFEEIAGWKTIETPEFFATYQVTEIKGIKSFKIVNVFLAKEFRGKGKAYELLGMLEKKAKDEGCSHFSAVVAKDASEFTQQRTVHILRSFGLELIHEDIYNKIYGRRF